MIDINDEMRKMHNSLRNVRNAINEFNSQLQLGEDAKRIIRLFFCYKKLDTYEKMQPSGEWYNTETKKLYITRIEDEIEKLGTTVYPTITTFPKEEWVEQIREYVSKDIEEYKPLIERFIQWVKSAHKQKCDYVYVALPEHGIKELVPSTFRENMYHNEIHNGIYAETNDNELWNYIGCQVVGDMNICGRKVIYSSNPFSEIVGDKAMLRKNVSVYRADANSFMPQIDFVITENGSPRFLFYNEWVSHSEREKCEECVVSYIPTGHLIINNLCYQDKDGKVIQIVDQAEFLEGEISYDN